MELWYKFNELHKVHECYFISIVAIQFFPDRGFQKEMKTSIVQCSIEQIGELQRHKVPTMKAILEDVSSCFAVGA